jgi:putative intracellular protease/amidase
MKVLVICARRFNGHELWMTLDVLLERGHTFVVAATEPIIADELDLSDQVRVAALVGSALRMQDYEGLMVVSGNMKDTESLWYHKDVQRLVVEADGVLKPIAAICCSVPAIRLATAGKKVSFFPLIRSRELLERAGAILTGTTMTRDHNLVTAEHQMASEYWVREYCNLLDGKPPQYHFEPTPLMSNIGGRRRRPPPELARLLAHRKEKENVARK